ncbi:MAG: CNNM domain-containing protein [Planctomycetota bacterium]|jgi:CBS domain containing-hemolysin-like protein|nr:CNNM domain-containing protein [Planctomycetota bacterium]
MLLINSLGFFFFLVINIFTSTAETGLYRVSQVRMRIRSDRGDRRAALVLREVKNLDKLITTILVASNISAYAGTYFFTSQFLHWGFPHAEILATIILTPLFFVLAESLPKQLAYHHADSWTPWLAPVLQLFWYLFSPIVRLLNLASLLLRRILGLAGDVELVSSGRARLMERFEAGVADNILTSEQNMMARRIMELESISAADIMIPCSRLPVIAERTSRAGIIQHLALHQEELVMLSGGSGRITGSVVTLDSLIKNPGKPEDSVEGLAVELGRIGSGAALSHVLLWLRDHHAQQAAVTERNRVIGIITSKSILSRIAEGGTGES